MTIAREKSGPDRGNLALKIVLILGAGVMFIRGGGSGLLIGMAREMCGLP